MFDIAWTEMLLVAVIAMVVVGPRDLPKVMRTVGSWVRKARGLAREFQGGIEQIARETELDELRKGADALKSFDPNQAMKKTLDPEGELDAELGGGASTSASASGTGGILGALSDPQTVSDDKPVKPDQGED